jgi:uroporphyrinogen decarboxylase
MNPKENLLKSINKNNPGWVPCPMLDGSMEVVFHNLIEYPDKSGKDEWGVEWVLGKERIGAGMPKNHPVKTIEEVYDYILPDPEKKDLMKNAIENLKNIDRTKSLVFGDNGWGIFERAWLLTGMDNLLIWMLEKPEVVKTLLKRITQIKVRITERFFEEVEVDGIRYGDDWGGESSLLMGPDLWREFIKPEQEKLYNAAKKKGGLILQHTDGHIEEIIPDLIEMGLDILNPLQPECNDVEKIKRLYGKDLSFHSVISSRVLDTGTEEEIDNEVKDKIAKMGYGGGYIIGLGHGLSYPENNLNAFRNAVIKYGNIPEKLIVKNRKIRGDVAV